MLPMELSCVSPCLSPWSSITGCAPSLAGWDRGNKSANKSAGHSSPGKATEAAAAVSEDAGVLLLSGEERLSAELRTWRTWDGADPRRSPGPLSARAQLHSS